MNAEVSPIRSTVKRGETIDVSGINFPAYSISIEDEEFGGFYLFSTDTPEAKAHEMIFAGNVKPEGDDTEWD